MEKAEISTAEIKDGGKFKEYIDSIDFDVLKNIYKKIYSRAGLDAEHMNFFEQEKIKNIDNPPYAGKYDAHTNAVTISLQAIESALSEKYPELSRKIVLASTIFHEETHALSKVECVPDTQFGKRERLLQRVGYVREEYDVQESESKAKVYITKKGSNQKTTREPAMRAPDMLFKGFNEGVTEKITREVFKEYADQTNSFTKQETDNFLAWEQENCYAFEKYLVDHFISKLTKTSGLSDKAAWEAVKSGLFTGDNLYKSELREYLDNELGDKYMEWLSRDKILHHEREQRGLAEQEHRNSILKVLKLRRAHRAEKVLSRIKKTK